MFCCKYLRSRERNVHLGRNAATSALGAAIDANRTLLRKGLIRIVTINCSGLRGERKKLALRNLLPLMKVGVCVVTENHLRLAKLKRLKIPWYRAVANFCSVAVGKKIGGGGADTGENKTHG